MEKIYIRIIDLLVMSYGEFADYCRSRPEQWNMPDEVDASFAQALGFKIAEMPEPREVQPWESAELVGRKNGSTYFAEWIYPELPNAAEIKRESIANKRWEVVEKSVINHNGVNYKTDKETRDIIGVMYFSAVLDPDYTEPSFKSADGFVSLNAADIISLGNAFKAHVKAAFAREDELSKILGATYLDW